MGEKQSRSVNRHRIAEIKKNENPTKAMYITKVSNYVYIVQYPSYDKYLMITIQ